jgi:hypothetical protein
MVHEDVSQNRQLRVNGGDLAELRSEGRSESLKGCGGVEFGDLCVDLSGDELALEVCMSSHYVSDWSSRNGMSNPQCSCFPVRICPSGGADCPVNSSPPAAPFVAIGAGLRASGMVTKMIN